MKPLGIKAWQTIEKCFLRGMRRVTNKNMFEQGPMETLELNPLNPCNKS